MGRTRVITAALTLAALPMLVAVCGQTKATNTRADENACRVEGELTRLAALPEASGVAVSRRVPGRLWTHNDSGQPVLFMLDARGGVTGRIQLSGATVVDWEAVSAGPCPTGSCLYVGDIGDNNARRDHITVYRLTEPGDTPSGAAASTAAAEAFHARYPDGPHDAETLLVAPDGGLYIVTKGRYGTGGDLQVSCRALARTGASSSFNGSDNRDRPARSEGASRSPTAPSHLMAHASYCARTRRCTSTERRSCSRATGAAPRR